MIVKNLITRYTDFVSLINDVRILSKLSYQIFDKYPKNIPKEIYKPIEDDLSFFAKNLKLYNAKQTLSYKEIKEKNTPVEYQPKTNLSGIFLESSVAKGIGDLFTKEIPVTIAVKSPIKLYSYFKKIILEEEFLSYFALFEAYLNSIISIILKKYPKKLNPTEIKNESKMIRWDEILQFDNYSDLVDLLVEKYIYSFGYKSIKDRLAILRKKEFGLDTQIGKDVEKSLDEIQEIRNCIIHNGGRLTRKSINILRKNNLKVGGLIVIKSNLNNDVFNIFKAIAFSLFKQTVTKYFNDDFEEIKKEIPYLDFLIEHFNVYNQEL